MRFNQPIAELRPIISSKQLRPFGLCAGEFTVPDDFDAPLQKIFSVHSRLNEDSAILVKFPLASIQDIRSQYNLTPNTCRKILCYFPEA